MAFRNQLQIRLAGLEENLDVPAFAVYAQDLLRFQADVCADEGNPIFGMITVADTDDPRRDGVSFPVCQCHIDGQQILGAPAPFLARFKNLLDVHPPAVQLIEHLGCLGESAASLNVLIM